MAAPSTVRSLLCWTSAIGLLLLLAPLAVAVVVLSLGTLRAPLFGLLQPFWSAVGLGAGGIRLQIEGREHLLERRPRMLVLNHSSVLDMLIIAGLNAKAPCPVFKKELRWVFPLNLVLWAMGGVYLDRGASEQAIAALKRAAARIQDERLTVYIAPEGTRSRDGKLAAFKSGAFHLARQAHAEIVPVSIHGAWDLCPPTGWKMRPGTVRVVIHPPWSHPGEPREQAAALREQYARWLAPGPLEGQ